MKVRILNVGGRRTVIIIILDVCNIEFEEKNAWAFLACLNRSLFTLDFCLFCLYLMNGY